MKTITALLVMMLAISSLTAQNELSRPDLPGELMIDVGLNYLDETPEDLTQRGWLSKSIGLYYTKRRVLGNRFAFNYGLGLGLEKLDFGSGQTLLEDGDDVVVGDFPFDANDSPVAKNRLALTYLDVPIEMRFYPRGTIEGEGLFVSVGGVAGLRLNAHTKWKYSEDGNDRVQKTSGSYDLNRIRYGYQVRFGYQKTHVFFKQYLSDVFNNPIDDSSPRMFTIGINFSGF